jgi:DNA mismatch repair ATPase MutS
VSASEDLQRAFQELAAGVGSLREQLKRTNALFSLGRISDQTYSEILDELEEKVKQIESSADGTCRQALRLLGEVSQNPGDVNREIEGLTARYRVGLVSSDRYVDQVTRLKSQKQKAERLQIMARQLLEWTNLKLVRPNKDAVVEAYEKLLKSFNYSWGPKRGQGMLEKEIEKCMIEQRRSREYAILRLADSRGFTKLRLAALS